MYHVGTLKNKNINEKNMFFLHHSLSLFVSPCLRPSGSQSNAIWTDKWSIFPRVDAWADVVGCLGQNPRWKSNLKKKKLGELSKKSRLDVLERLGDIPCLNHDIEKGSQENLKGGKKSLTTSFRGFNYPFGGLYWAPIDSILFTIALRSWRLWPSYHSLFDELLRNKISTLVSFSSTPESGSFSGQQKELHVVNLCSHP